jgi:hypothetical protein
VQPASVSQSSEVLHCDASLRRGSLLHVTEATCQWAVATLLQLLWTVPCFIDLLGKVNVETRAILELRAENFALRRRGGPGHNTSAIRSKRHHLKRRMKEGGAA